MGLTLPGGFSPWQAIQQIADDANPFDGGSRDRDIFSQSGNQVYGVDQNAPLDGSQYGAGAVYPDYTSAQSGNTLGANSQQVSSGPSYDVARYNQARSLLNSQLGRLDSQLGIANQNIDNQFSTRNNELDSGFAAGKNQYGTQSTQNRQNLVGDRNLINDQASQGLRGLMRMLGAYGAGGSSDRFLAGGAVTNQANMQMSGAGQNYSGNQQSLDTNFGNFEAQDKQERAKLGDWRTQRRNQAQQQSLSTRQDILARLASLEQSPEAGQSYIDQANALGGQIDQLGAFAPAYTGQSPVFQAPTLDSYNVGSAGVSARPQAGGSTPFLSLIMGQDDERRRF